MNAGQHRLNVRGGHRGSRFLQQGVWQIMAQSDLHDIQASPPFSSLVRQPRQNQIVDRPLGHYGSGHPGVNPLLNPREQLPRLFPRRRQRHGRINANAVKTALVMARDLQIKGLRAARLDLQVKARQRSPLKVSVRRRPGRQAFDAGIGKHVD